MALSGLAERLLESHVREPAKLFYNIWLLGGYVTGEGEKAIDAAYRELEADGLMESARNFITFFGSPKTLFRVTQAGKQHVANFAEV